MSLSTIYRKSRLAVIGSSALLLFILMALGSLPASAQSTINMPTPVIVHLEHAPTGTAYLRWNAQRSILIATVTVTGLQSNSSHPADIRAGNCTTGGAGTYMLNPVVANAAGNAISTTVIPNVTGGIPMFGWSINVHSGPTLTTPDQALSISCGNIVNRQKLNSVVVPLYGTYAANQMAGGVAFLTLHRGSLIVETIVYGLVPGSEHMAHIHAGSCERQIPGNIVYPLTQLTANAEGVAASTTVIPGVNIIPRTGWYINIHFGTNLAVQTQYDVIACGDVNS